MSRKGFTLIELLVVVLIIGILASVALPQYQKAVEKARVSEALANLKTLRNAVDVFFLEQGYNTVPTKDQLAVQVAESKGFYYSIEHRSNCSSYDLAIRAERKTHRYRLWQSWDGCTKTWTQTCSVENPSSPSSEARYICSYLQGYGYAMGS